MNDSYARLRAYAEQATQGPWYTHADTDGNWPVWAGDPDPDSPTATHLAVNPFDGVRAGFTRTDAEYVVAANPTAITGLLDELDQIARERAAVLHTAGVAYLMQRNLRMDTDEDEQIRQKGVAQIRGVLDRAGILDEIEAVLPRDADTTPQIEAPWGLNPGEHGAPQPF